MATPAHTVLLAPISRYFEASLYLLVCAGFATLASTGTLDFFSLSGMILALSARGYFLARRSATPVLHERWTSLLTVAYLVFYAVDYLMLSRQFVDATMHLLLFATAAKLFSLRRERDNVYLAVLAFLQVLIASILTVDATFLAAFLLFTAIAVATFVSYEMKRSATNAQVSAKVVRRRIARPLTATAMLVLLSIALGTVGLFFVIPRVTGGYLSRYAPQNSLVSGFSDSVNFGAIGTIQQSEAVVLRVQLRAGTMPPDVKWRGVALDTFDGLRWTAPRSRQVLEPASRGVYDIGEVRGSAMWQVPRSSRLNYRVMSEPIGTDVFFVIPWGEELAGDYSQVAIDSGGALYNHDFRRGVAIYSAWSNPVQPSPNRLRAAGNMYPASVALRYLQLPGVDPRVVRLASQISSGSTNAFDRAVAIESFLKNGFGYTLELPPRIPEDPVAHFLFERKKGHCEYFASAMAVMLRTQGVPARIVNGFRGAEYNDITGSYLVRARDAHSWVEAYFPGAGWVAFDPTPAGGADAGWSRLALYVDAMREFWREWVVNYDFSHQHRVATTAFIRSRISLRRLRFSMSEWYEGLLDRLRSADRDARTHPRRWIGWALALVLIGAIAAAIPLLVRALVRARVARRGSRAPAQAATVWFARLERLLARKGWPREPAQTPFDFAQSVSEPEVRRAVAAFVSTYERARYGASAADAVALPAALEQVRTTLR